MTRILIAEDDKDIRELIVITLQFNGFDVVSAEDGAAAVSKAKSEGPFDLILMDVRMPRMTGYEACRHLKEDAATRDIPVIFLSAKGQESEIQTGMDAGASQYILKPFAPDVLVNTINDVLNKAQS
ncbi:MAG: response regulator [Chloroflexi bacterium]|nr:MAG: response regulator [Chloroflexota bacterium]